jgi:hypothetical protein
MHDVPGVGASAGLFAQPQGRARDDLGTSWGMSTLGLGHTWAWAHLGLGPLGPAGLVGTTAAPQFLFGF